MQQLPKYIIGVLIPTRGTVFTRTMTAAMRETSPYANFWFTTTDLPLPESRNSLIKAAIDSKIPFTHYLLVDDDVVMPEGSLDRMLKLNVDVAIVDYPTHWMGNSNAAKTGNIAYVEYDEATGKHGETIAWAGLGCTLVRSDVFHRIAKPWFRLGGRPFERDKKGMLVFTGIVEDPKGGEDFEFFFDCHQQKMTIARVPDMIAEHGKIMRHIGVMTQGKYQSSHDIMYADSIERPGK